MRYINLVLLSCLAGQSLLNNVALAGDEEVFLGQVHIPSEQTLGQGRSAIWTMPFTATQYFPSKPTPAIQSALHAQREGKFLEALALLDEAVKSHQTSAETQAGINLLRASFLLQGNQSRQALTILAPLLSSPQHAADAYALTTMAYLQRGQSQEAQDAANHSLNPAQGSEGDTLPPLAQSYALQSVGHLEEARAVLHGFNARTPHSAIALAREAELALTLDHTQAAADTLTAQALQLDATHPYVIAVSGLTHLIEGQAQQAQSAFETALKLDPKDAKALFGLGLAEIKLGDLQAGFKNLQAANESDPSSALILTYLGRVQQQLGLTEAAQASWRSARQADPNDPVPWLYQAQAALQDNKPLEARDNLREAQARTANRAVYRGDRLLREDFEILLSNLSEVQRQLGLERIAFQTLSDSTGEKSSANLRNQADVLQGQRFGESARRSLLLQSLFNDKPGSLPLALDIYGDGAGQTGASVPQHGVVNDLNPIQASYNNYDSLFSQRATLAADATTGSKNTNGEQVRLGIGNDTLGMSLAGLQFKTDGFDYQNTDYGIPQGLLHQHLDNSVAQIVVQWRPTESTQAFVQYQTFKSNHGEMHAPADPNNYGLYYQYQDTSGVARVGLRQSLDDSSELRVIYSHQQTGQIENKEWLSDYLPPTNQNYSGPGNTNGFTYGPGNTIFSNDNSSEASTGELQYRRSGAGYTTQWGVSSTRSLLAIQAWSTPPNTNIAHQIYVDWQQVLNSYWQLEAGMGWGEYVVQSLTFDNNGNLVDNGTDVHDWLPKLGLVYSPDSATHIRFAAWKGLDSAAAGDASLAPATLAGFMLNRTNDTYKLVRGVALGADKQLNVGWLLEGRVQRRWTDTPENIANSTRLIPQHTDETRLALHWQPGDQSLNLTVTYDDEFYKYDDMKFNSLANSIQEQHLRSAQLDLRWFLSQQLTANFAWSHNQLDAIQQSSDINLNPILLDVSQSFNMTDASVSWKFNQNSSLDTGVRNATNTNVLYTELDPLIPRFSQGRLVYTKLKLSW